MSHENPLDPLHRLDNYAKGLFFQAYSILRRYATETGDVDTQTFQLQAVCTVMEEAIAKKLDLPLEALRLRLDGVGSMPALFKDGQDQAGFPTA